MSPFCEKGQKKGYVKSNILKEPMDVVPSYGLLWHSTGATDPRLGHPHAK